MGGGSTQPQLLKPQLLHQQISSSSKRQHHRAQQLFPVGSAVEVQTDEEDFKGVYFVATVIADSSPKKKGSRKVSRKLRVEYHNLLACEDGSERLTEFVDVSFVRPAPPPQEVVSCFEPDDVVDAFYKDGWWTGRVTRVVPGGERFVITFLDPPDELEFGLADLRVHWSWVDGSWVRPVKQRVAALMFDVGRKVEVSLSRQDFEAWFPATIHENLGDGSFSAEYPCASSDSDPQTVKITVDSLHIRPCPPLLKDKTFALLEKVDAYFDCGWWSGIVTKVLEDSKYTVFFQQTKRAEEFHLSKLRPHMEWKDGRWFTSSQDVTLPSPDDYIPDHHIPENSNGNTAAGLKKILADGKIPSLDLRKNQFDRSSPVNGKPLDVPASRIRRRQYSSDSSNVLSQPPKKPKEGNVLNVTQEDIHDGSTEELLSAALSPDPVKIKTDSTPQAAIGDQPPNGPSWGKRIKRRRRKFSSTRTVGKKVVASNPIKKCTVQRMPYEGPGNVLERTDPGTPKEDVKIEHSKEDAERPVIIGLPCAEIGSSGFGTSRVKRGRHSNIRGIMKLLIDQQQVQLDETKDGKNIEARELSVKKKRGRPRKIPLKSLLTPEKGDQNGCAASDDVNRKDGDLQGIAGVPVAGVEDPLPNQEMILTEDTEKSATDPTKSANVQSDPRNRKRSVSRRISPRTHNEQLVKQFAGVRQKRTFKRGRRHNTCETVAAQVQDSIDASGSKKVQENSILEVQKVVTEAPCSGHDDEPLSKWIEGMHSPSVVHRLRESPVSTVEQCMEKGEKQGDYLLPEDDKEKRPEIELQASASVDEGSVVPYEECALPFVKNTFLWKTIEAMEVFQRMPQRPHFQPLEDIKESSREGLAIGYMVTFASVAEKASRLQLNDPQSVTDDLVDTLVDLERHGFDTRGIQERINELLAAKEKQGKLLDEVNELNTQILECSREKSRIEEEINEINEQILKLQQRLSLAESSKEAENEKIALLQARIRETGQCIKNVEREIETVNGSGL